MKKIIALMLCLCLLLGSVSAVSAENFSDVPRGVYYYEPVYNLVWDNIISGYPDGTFGPIKPITRAEMAVLLVNMLGLKADNTAAQRFSDVPSSHWAFGFVATAAAEGFVNGYPGGTFRPNTPVSYDEALTMIVALLGYKAADLPGSYPKNFTDKAKQLGVMNTCVSTGKDPATRANVACFIRDAIFVLTKDKDLFKYEGPGYTVSLGSDWVYYYTDDPSKEWCHTVLILENTSDKALYIGLSSFDLYVNDIKREFDSSEYFKNDDISYPGGDLAPGKKMYVDLIYPYKANDVKTDIICNLTYMSDEEPTIELTRTKN